MTRRLFYGAMAMGGFLLVLAALLKWAEHARLLAPDHASRGGQVAIGLVLAAYANLMPKRVASARTQTALRAGGWAFLLAGFGYALLWALAPVSLAWPASLALVGAATLICLIFTAWACAGRA